MSEENTAGSEEAAKKQFSIQKIYTKDLSFEAPNSPKIFLDKWQPEVNMELSNNAQTIGPKTHEVVLTVTVTAKLGDKTAYLVEVQQAGIFVIDGLSQPELGATVGSYCPNLLFPYAREAVSDIVTRGGFPQLLLAPVNFDALYAQHMQQQKQQAAAGTGDAAAGGSETTH